MMVRGDRALAPKLFLDLVHDRTEAIHVRDVDDETRGIAQGRAFGFGDQLHVGEGLADTRLVAHNLQVGFRIDAAHAGDVDEVARAGADFQGPVGLIAPSGASVFTPEGDNGNGSAATIG